MSDLNKLKEFMFISPESLEIAISFPDNLNIDFLFQWSFLSNFSDEGQTPEESITKLFSHQHPDQENRKPFCWSPYMFLFIMNQSLSNTEEWVHHKMYELWNRFFCCALPEEQKMALGIQYIQPLSEKNLSELFQKMNVFLSLVGQTPLTWDEFTDLPNRPVDLSNRIIHEDDYFECTNLIFPTPVSFKNSVFKEHANFNISVFCENVDFSDAHFEGGHFNESDDESNFDKCVWFNNTQFLKTVSFEGVFFNTKVRH